MLKLIVSNSATGARAEEIIDGNTTVAEVMEMPKFSSFFTGQTMMLNGNTLQPGDLHKSLNDLGASTTSPNVLVSVKAANGAC